MFEDTDIIYSYTRKQAIEDGNLVEVDKAISKKAGFKIPVCLSIACYLDCVEWKQGERELDLKENERCFHLLLSAIEQAIQNEDSDTVKFIHSRIPRAGQPLVKDIELLLMVHGDDEGNPCLTIGFERDF